MGKRPACLRPFFEVSIHQSGATYFCCDGYTNYSIGNIYEQPFDEIWNGEKARGVRRQMLLGDMSYCKFGIGGCNMRDAEGESVIGRKFSEEEMEECREEMPPPKVVRFSYDYECNARCITCRRGIYANSEKMHDFLNSHIDKTFLPMMKGAEKVYTSGSGDPLASRHTRKLLKCIMKRYPDIKIELHTNGILASEDNFKKLGLISPDGSCRVCGLLISIHAATKKTYDKIVRNGDWDAVMNNLKWLSEMKKQNKGMRGFTLNFTLQSINFREVPDFIELAHKFGGIPAIWEYRNFGAQNEKGYRELSVSDPRHRDHSKLVKVLKKVDAAYLSPWLVKLAKDGAPRKTWAEKWAARRASKRWHNCED